MLASGKTEAVQVPRFTAIAGQLAYQAGDYAEAHNYLQQAVNAGFTENNSEVILAESYIGDNKAAQGLGVLKNAITSRQVSGALAPDAWYRRGLISAYKAGMPDETADFGAMLILDYPKPGNVGLAATILREISDFGAQETLDLMRIIGRSNSYVEERDYVEYIQAADPRRLPGEVLDIIAAGTASGKLNASDTFVADARAQASERAAGDRASLPDYANDARSANATVATVTGAADALLSYNDAAQAEELYTLALVKGPQDVPRVVTRLGIAQFDQGNYAQAQATLGKVTGKRASIAKLWSAYAAQKARAAAAAAPPATATAE
jgi:tetratricopeptide (TPR) repeat protein